MDDARWPQEMRRLLPLVLARGQALPSGDFDAWLAGAAPDRHPRVVRERLASGTDVYGLDVTDALRPDGDFWLEVRPVRGSWVEVGYDAQGGLAIATLHDTYDGPKVVAIGDRDDDGTDWFVGYWNWREPRIAARRTLGDGTVVVVSASWIVGISDGLPDVIVSATAPPHAGRARVLHAQLLTSVDGEVPGRVVTGVDELRFDAAGRPVERWVDRTARWDFEAGEQPNQVSSIASRTTDPLALLDPTIDVLRARDRVTTAAPILLWATRLHDPPSVTADPVDPFDDTAVEQAAVGLRDAVVAAAATSTLPSPCAVCIEWKSGDSNRFAAIPDLVLVDRAFRDAFARLPSDRHALGRTSAALEEGEAERFALGPFVDDETVGAWRRLLRANDSLPGVTAEQQATAARDLVRVRRRALALLLDHRWPSHWDESVVPWLPFGPPSGADPTGYAGVDPAIELRELGDAATFDRLWPTRTPIDAGQGPSTGDDDRDAHGAPVDSREALRERFGRGGLGGAASALAAAARWGWTMHPDDGTLGQDDPRRTRIGGRPLLPPNTPWPTTADGEPLTFVAVVDLGSAPPLPEPVVLPAGGLLLFYVLVGDTDRDDGLLAFVEDEPASETARVFHVPAGTDPVAVDPLGQPLMLPQDYGHPTDEPVDRPVSLRPALMPVDDLDVGERFGLHRSVVDRYYEIVWALRGDRADEDARAIGTVLGFEAGAQGVGVADDELVLLAINGDADVGLDWGDAGDLRVLIDRAAAESGRWEQAYAVGDCG